MKNKIFWISFAGVLAAYAASLLASRAPTVEVFFAVVVLAVAAAVFYKNFSAGVAIVIAELVAGSFGHLFNFPGGVSVRMGLFALALAATAIRLVRYPTERAAVREFLWRPVWLVGALAIGWGTIYGLALHGRGALADANAYAFFLLFPTVFLTLRDAPGRRLNFETILGAVTASSLLTLAVFTAFTHALPEPILAFVYKWVRDYGLGEITRAPGGFYRVFFQTQLWNLIAFLAGPAALIWLRKKNLFYHSVVAVGLSAAVVFVSFSRTFWLAALAAMALGFIFILARREFRGSRRAYAVILLALLAFGLALPFVLSRSVGGAVLTRANPLLGEAAVDSRMNLLKVMLPAALKSPILGYGFGKELTYKTLDPRLLALYPDGNYTTAAFEWGWLDFWLKMGLIGPVFFIWLVGLLLWRGYKKIRGAATANSWPVIGLLVAIIGISLAHVFSPWLNHPLGIGLLLIAGAILLE